MQQVLILNLQCVSLKSTLAWNSVVVQMRLFADGCSPLPPTLLEAELVVKKKDFPEEIVLCIGGCWALCSVCWLLQCDHCKLTIWSTGKGNTSGSKLSDSAEHETHVKCLEHSSFAWISSRIAAKLISDNRTEADLMEKKPGKLFWKGMCCRYLYPYPLGEGH